MTTYAIHFTTESIRDAEQMAAHMGESTTRELARHSFYAACSGTASDAASALRRAIVNAASAYSYAQSAEEMRAELAELIAEAR